MHSHQRSEFGLARTNNSSLGASPVGPSSLPSRRLRIAFLVHDYNRWGGHSRYVAELARRFKRDHEVHVFANRFEEPEPQGITFHYVPALRTSALTTILSFILPATLAMGRRFDIIHSQGLCGLRQNVATAHFCQAAWFDALARQKVGLTWRQRLSRFLVARLERAVLCHPSTRRVIAVSERIRSDLAECYGRQAGVRIIRHGVDSTTFHPLLREYYRCDLRTELHVREDECLALYVGDAQKGAAAAIRAVARVPGVRLLIISPSDLQAYQTLARAEEVSQRVLFRPLTDRIERFFACADIFVFPTVYDSYGMVISEAMASALPVLTSRAAGAAELIEHGIDGLLTDSPWDLDQIAAGLGRLAADAGLRARLGAAARAKIERHTWDAVAEQTLGVYREVLAEQPCVS